MQQLYPATKAMRSCALCDIVKPHMVQNAPILTRSPALVPGVMYKADAMLCRPEEATVHGTLVGCADAHKCRWASAAPTARFLGRHPGATTGRETWHNMSQTAPCASTATRPCTRCPISSDAIAAGSADPKVTATGKHVYARQGGRPTVIATGRGSGSIGDACPVWGYRRGSHNRRQVYGAGRGGQF